MSTAVTEKAWVLDVDGPLCDPEAKQVTRPEVLGELILRLSNGEPVMLNTGRDVAWVYARVVSRLITQMEAMGLDPVALCRGLLLVGEKGGSVAHADGRGGVHVDHDSTLAVPRPLQDAVADLVEREFADIMRVDTGKLTMMSIEMRDGASLQEYVPRQRAFVSSVQALRDSMGHTDTELRVDATRIAVDIQDARAGKGLGAERCAQWMATVGLAPLEVVTVGDSASDIEMADRFHALGVATRFVDVGNTVIPPRPFPVQREALYEAGTVSLFATDRHLRPHLLDRAAAPLVRVLAASAIAPAPGRTL